MASEQLEFRRAQREDVITIVGMLANDPLGNKRESWSDPLPEAYYEAFEKINSDPNQHLIVAETEGRIVASLQLTVIPYLSYQGGSRAQIETVRVHEDYRGKGLGHQLFRWAIDRSRELGCHVLQLTTDKQRPEALRFYEQLGFKASHEGMKLHL